MFENHVLEEEFHFKLLSLDTTTMDPSDSPITVSEIPPTKESSGLSLFYKLGEKSSSQISEKSTKSQKSSFSNSLKQTLIENWITSTARQSIAITTTDTDHKPPPWATTSNRLSLEEDFSFATAPQSEEIFEDICEINSECSLPVIDDKFNNNLKPVDKLIFDDEYSVMAKDFGSILSEEEPYATPRPDLCDKRPSPFQDDNSEGDPPYLTRVCNNLDTQATVPYNHNNNSQATIPYNHESNTQASLRYKCDIDSQTTIPYNHDSSSQATIPYDCCGSSQETVPYDANTDSQSEDHYTANESIHVSHDGQEIDQSNVENLFENDDVDLPLINSPAGISDGASIFDSPNLDYEELEELSKIADELSNTDKRQYAQIDSVEISTHSPTKSQKLSSCSTQKRQSDLSSPKSPEIVKLVRPDKKQLRSSTLKQPMTIESYFLFSSESNGQSEEDIGRDSVAPSSFIGKAEGDKKDDKTLVKPIDSRKRPSFGLSKRI